LGGHISNLQTTFEERLFDLVPTDKVDFSFIVLASFPKELTHHPIDFERYRFGG
jgi:hypothetical protein